MVRAIFITFLVATSMVYYTLAQEEEISDISPSPEAAAMYDHELLSHMTTQRIHFLQNCSDKLTSKCGMEMTEGLIKEKPVSEECCKDLFTIGRDCHEALMNFVFSTYELKDLATKILPRSKRIWNQCVQTTAARVGAPIAFEA